MVDTILRGIYYIWLLYKRQNLICHIFNYMWIMLLGISTLTSKVMFTRFRSPIKFFELLGEIMPQKYIKLFIYASLKYDGDPRNCITVFYHNRLTLGIDYSGWMQASSAIWIKREKRKAKEDILRVTELFACSVSHILCFIILWITYVNIQIAITVTSFYLMVRFNTSSHIYLNE